MIRFALIAASVLGFALTAALGNLMVPLLRELQRTMRGAQPEQETDRKEPEEPVPTIGGLCLMVGTLAAVGAGWLAACAAQPSLLGSDRQMMSRLLIALLGTFAFGGSSRQTAFNQVFLNALISGPQVVTFILPAARG